uniref:Uncharacterized protein n=1 Tax=Erythrolobus madagascarensis TaxID=708628 RepID=A0A7S0XNZ5_9RHOD|mmetsp:Transcript_78/g.133  ORF Transcript_78/g.133 Transcript_78/m.133 type:complete len:209 (+) Transcript_78:49-675(+)
MKSNPKVNAFKESSEGLFLDLQELQPVELARQSRTRTPTPSRRGRNREHAPERPDLRTRYSDTSSKLKEVVNDQIDAGRSRPVSLFGHQSSRPSLSRAKVSRSVTFDSSNEMMSSGSSLSTSFQPSASPMDAILSPAKGRAGQGRLRNYTVDGLCELTSKTGSACVTPGVPVTRDHSLELEPFESRTNQDQLCIPCNDQNDSVQMPMW